MSIPIHGPIVFLRCKKCGGKTDHVLICHVTITKSEIEETYECQQCGETKRVYELVSMKKPEEFTIEELKRKIKTKSVVDPEGRLEEQQRKRRLF